MSILASGPLMFSEPNCPTRVGEMVETVNDLYNISSPREGMLVFVKAEKKTYVITSLKEKVVNGVSIPNAAVDKFELMGDVDVVWSAESNMNDFTTAGVYNITGERTVDTDNLPILNTGGGHTFDAKLFVLDSSIPGDGKNTDKCVTQILTFSNRVGGDGNVYIRTGRGVSEDNLTWEAWSTLLKNKNVGVVTTLDDLIDNGVYSGVFFGDGSKPHETFILVVINDYQVTVTDRHVSQFYYSVDSYTGETTYNTRTGSGTPIKWSDWHYVNYLKIQKDIEDLVLGYINISISELIGTAPETLDTIHEIASWIVNDKTGAAAMAQQIESLGENLGSAFELIHEETNNRTEAINNVKSKAIGIERFTVSKRENEVGIAFAPVDSNAMQAVTIPAATTEKAGVMSAEDKVALDTATSRALRALFVAAGAEYNDTGQIIQKTAPWETEEKWRLEDDGTYTYWEEPATVEHLPRHYYLNGLGDITEEQMMEIYNQRWQISQNISNMFALSNIRTNFLPQNKGLRKLDTPSGIYAKGAFQNCVNAEVLILCIQLPVNNTQIYSLQVGYGASMFRNNKKLKHVIGTYSCESITDTTTLTTMFIGCNSLKTVDIYNCNKEVSFADCPNISKKSVLYTIQNAAPTAAITITLHPDAYVRIANQPDIIAALEAQPLITLVSA